MVRNLFVFKETENQTIMTKDKKEQKGAEDQEFTNSNGFDTGEDYPNCEGESCANMADGDDTGAEEENEADEAAVWKDKYMRLSAEFENYRKRTLKEKLDLINTGSEDVMKSMLEVLDDMDRALAAMEKTEDMEAVRQGIILIDDKLRGTLKNKGLCEMKCVGEDIDADLHEAVARIETAEKAMKGKIVDVIQKGYKLKEKIIRYPKVVVGQ